MSELAVVLDLDGCGEAATGSIQFGDRGPLPSPVVRWTRQRPAANLIGSHWSDSGLVVYRFGSSQEPDAAWGGRLLETSLHALRLQCSGCFRQTGWHDFTPDRPASSRHACTRLYVSLMAAQQSRATVDEREPTGFDAEDLSEASNNQYLLKWVRSDSGLPYAQELVARLSFLCAADDEDGTAPSAKSLASLISFLLAHPRLRYPLVTTNPKGRFTARWRADDGRALVVEFRSQNEVNFVLFAPGEGRTLRLSGLATPRQMWKTVRAHEAEEWCTA